MMSQQVPQQKILIFKRIEKPLIDSNKVTVTTNKQKLQIDDAYKEFFASLFKIKDKDVQRRVLQAVNGQNLTCADCANRIQSKVLIIKKNPEDRTTFSSSTQTLDKDFEYLEKINISPKTLNNAKTNNNRECFVLNKIQLGRARRKFEPYAVKMKTEKCVIPNNKLSYLKYEPDSLLSKIHKPKPKVENPSPVQTDYSITQKLVLDNFDQSMSPHGFFNVKPNEQPSKLNDVLFLSTMEEEMRTAGVFNEEGLYTMHIATINGDLFKLRRLLVIFKYKNWDVNIYSKDGKGETPLHFAMSCVNNVHNKEIINALYDNGSDVLATNDVGDTVLHLAAETIRDYNTIEKLLSKISLNDLTKQNDKSQTILHVATANKNRVFVKSILNFIDDKLNISSIGKGVPFSEEADYFQQLDALHLNYVKTFICENFTKPTINAVKAKILNEPDGRSGKTAVFLSLDNNDQSTCLMLLAHFADTRIQDFSNTTCAFYCTDVLKNQILAQAIYHADSMHNSVVVKALKQTEKHRSYEHRKRGQTNDDNDDDDSSDIMAKVAKVFC